MRNGPGPFAIYFAGTYTATANIVSTTLVAGYYSMDVYNFNTTQKLVIFDTVTCVPPSS